MPASPDIPQARIASLTPIELAVFRMREPLPLLLGVRHLDRLFVELLSRGAVDPVKDGDQLRGELENPALHPLASALSREYLFVWVEIVRAVAGLWLVGKSAIFEDARGGHVLRGWGPLAPGTLEVATAMVTELTEAFRNARRNGTTKEVEGAPELVGFERLRQSLATEILAYVAMPTSRSELAALRNSAKRDLVRRVDEYLFWQGRERDTAERDVRTVLGLQPESLRTLQRKYRSKSSPRGLHDDPSRFSSWKLASQWRNTLWFTRLRPLHQARVVKAAVLSEKRSFDALKTDAGDIFRRKPVPPAKLPSTQAELDRLMPLSVRDLFDKILPPPRGGKVKVHQVILAAFLHATFNVSWGDLPQNILGAHGTSLRRHWRHLESISKAEDAVSSGSPWHFMLEVLPLFHQHFDIARLELGREKRRVNE
jgi:hypothetical protein